MINSGRVFLLHCGILHISQMMRGSFGSDVHQRKCKVKWPAGGSSLDLPGMRKAQRLLSSVEEGHRRVSCSLSQSVHLAVRRFRQDKHHGPSVVQGYRDTGSSCLLLTFPALTTPYLYIFFPSWPHMPWDEAPVTLLGLNPG